ncbi:hypothetical protein MP638_005288 [Amoeboaphelidium occidentale]|nr:hypothetical protein MP638_005288 [Amoeboaphelidium occidentale]
MQEKRSKLDLLQPPPTRRSVLSSSGPSSKKAKLYRIRSAPANSVVTESSRSDSNEAETSPDAKPIRVYDHDGQILRQSRSALELIQGNNNISITKSPAHSRANSASNPIIAKSSGSALTTFLTTKSGDECVILYDKDKKSGKSGKSSGLKPLHHRFYSRGTSKHTDFRTSDITLPENGTVIFKQDIGNSLAQNEKADEVVAELEKRRVESNLMDSMISKFEKLFHSNSSQSSMNSSPVLNRSWSYSNTNLHDTLSPIAGEITNAKTKLKQLLFTHFKPFSDIHLDNSKTSPASPFVHEDRPSTAPSTQPSVDEPNGVQKERVKNLVSKLEPGQDSKEKSRNQRDSLHTRSASSNDTLSKQKRKSSYRIQLSPENDKQQNYMNLLSPAKLFENMVIVSIVEEKDEDSGKTYLVPKITYQFPPSSNALSMDSVQSKESVASRKTNGSSSTSETELFGNIPLFCFPEWSSSYDDHSRVTIEEYIKDDSRFPSDSLNGETFSFMLTDIERTKMFGYCRRIFTGREVECEVEETTIQGSGSKRGLPVTRKVKKKKRLPEVLSIISPVGCFSMFNEILDIVVKKKTSGCSSSHLHAFMKAVIAQPFPKPGKTMVIRTMSDMRRSLGDLMNPNAMEEYSIERPLDLVSLEHSNYVDFFSALGFKTAEDFMKGPRNILFSLLAAIINERKIIFVSKSLHRLSNACNVAIELIYPMEWQHAIIPILPRKLTEFVCSPTPYVIGMVPQEAVRVLPGFKISESDGSLSVPNRPKSKSTKDNRPFSAAVKVSSKLGNDTETLPVEDAFVLDLDHGLILRHDSQEEDNGLFPLFIQNSLLDSLHASSVDPSNTQLSSRNVAIFKCFLRLFTGILGPYRQFMDFELSPIEKSKHETEQKLTVKFDTDKFTSKHPILINQKSCWEKQIKSSTSGKLQLKEKEHFWKFLCKLSKSQNFQYFIQEREEGFQYHYQDLLERTSMDKKVLETVQNGSSKKQALPSGLKYYYSLAQSRFEQLVSKVEQENASEKS